MQEVHVKLFAMLRDYGPKTGIGQAFTVEVPAGATAGSLLEGLKIPPGIVKSVFVNGLIRDVDYQLCDGDELGIFPPIAGGWGLSSPA